MNLNKMFVFIFVFFGLFSTILVTMPTEFLLLGVETSVQDKEVVEYFNAHDVLTYNFTLGFNLTFGEEQQYEMGLAEDTKLEFWWNEEPYFGMGDIEMFEIRHLERVWLFWWYAYHELEVIEPYATSLFDPEVGLRKDDVIALWDDEANHAYCEFECEHIAVKLFIMPASEEWTMEQSWDNHIIQIYTSYNVDWDETGVSMWHIIGQLLAWQAPALGIPGVGGLILSRLVSLAMWGSIAILFFALITAIVPFIPGWPGRG